ncbi:MULTISPECIES: NAD-dependent protein deacylase [unclassified Enterococcus]|uniref:NAD-dependent protein deacylase n=1 Tax=unclassified Enterococcus TaxID=2608891 RepID=UPI001CE14300|nr:MULTISPECIES: NAD-dependent protein deacylase [unclassified Enterococcus]MCA5013835.1 NAD-dependent protein deacylase [Enterococcus sp. S23]MCA5017085.1 NAD-dependent protein deacylase [Enterococcus sp. S22(2020)]
METIDQKQALHLIKEGKKITFLTGAGISTPSGIPDYRSLAGVYQGIEQPEYLLSVTCLEEEPQKFYDFIQTLYHPNARPNMIHSKIAALEKIKETWVISQNIDGLHKAAGSHNLVDFHGSLYDCYCQTCGQKVSSGEYLTSDKHLACGGQLRPGIVLYEEGLDQQTITAAIKAVEQADLVVIVGTSFQVHPFCDLIHYASEEAVILVINQTTIQLNRHAYFLKEKAEIIFENI